MVATAEAMEMAAEGTATVEAEAAKIAEGAEVMSAQTFKHSPGFGRTRRPARAVWR